MFAVHDEPEVTNLFLFADRGLGDRDRADRASSFLLEEAGPTLGHVGTNLAVHHQFIKIDQNPQKHQNFNS